MSNYVPNFPTFGFPLDNFQPFTDNFNALDSVFETDHTLFSEPNSANRGHHKFVRFFNVQADPALANPQAQLYTKDQTAGADTYRSLYFAQKPNTAAQIIRQMTDLAFTSVAKVDGGTTVNFRIYDTPWGWRILMGNSTGAFSGAKNFTFTSPGDPLILPAILYANCAIGGNGSGPSTSSFNITQGAGTSTLNLQTGTSVSVSCIVISSNV